LETGDGASFFLKEMEWAEISCPIILSERRSGSNEFFCCKIRCKSVFYISFIAFLFYFYPKLRLTRL
jgi:hypothetical protein